MSGTAAKMGPNAAWSMAVGGMVGGGIFSTLGVVIEIAGPLAWLSFLAAGFVALLAGYSYVKLAAHYHEGGGAYTYLRKVGAEQTAGVLVWVLLAGYVLTNSVYAFTFGQYLAEVIHLGAWFPRFAAVTIIGVFVAVNLRGVGEAGFVEIALVWFKVAVLVGLAGWGLAHWSPGQLSHGAASTGFGAVIFGAASVFMAYEGFQLLAYDYDDIANPRRTLPPVVLSAIAAVIVIYVLVAVGTAMLIGADEIVNYKEVALARAGRAALGTFGLGLVTLAAAASTGSAINSTLFATARLTRDVARAGDLPAWLGHHNRRDLPGRAIVGLGLAAAVPAAMGNLEMLVEGASLAFLVTFSIVCVLAWQQRAGHRLWTGLGVMSGLTATSALVVRLVRVGSPALWAWGGLLVAAVAVRPWLKRHR